MPAANTCHIRPVERSTNCSTSEEFDTLPRSLLADCKREKWMEVVRIDFRLRTKWGKRDASLELWTLINPGRTELIRFASTCSSFQEPIKPAIAKFGSAVANFPSARRRFHGKFLSSLPRDSTWRVAQSRAPTSASKSVATLPEFPLSPGKLSPRHWAGIKKPSPWIETFHGKRLTFKEERTPLYLTFAGEKFAGRNGAKPREAPNRWLPAASFPIPDFRGSMLHRWRKDRQPASSNQHPALSRRRAATRRSPGALARTPRCVPTAKLCRPRFPEIYRCD